MQWKYFILRLLFIQFAKTMRVADKSPLLVSRVMKTLQINSSELIPSGYGNMSPTSKYKRKISLDLLITKFLKRYLSLNLQVSSSLYFFNFICSTLFVQLDRKSVFFMFLIMQHLNVKLSMLMLSVYYAKHY